MKDAVPSNARPQFTLAEGQPVAQNDATTQIPTTFGGGYALLTSTQLIEQLAHFARERIPERVVHAKAAAAGGYFEVTDDVSDLTDANFLTGLGRRTEAFTRISTVGPERGSADTVRDFRGFAIKLKTEQGNQDFVFNNQPVFFVRNPAKFPSLNRSHKRNPVTNAADADMFWDFHVNSPESIHALMFLFGDRGIPKSVRHINAYSGNTYMWTKADGTFHYAQTRIDMFSIYKQPSTEANIHPGPCTFKCYNPHATLSASHRLSIFDMTKVWPHAEYPLRRVGKLVLDHNPENWFVDVEQAAFTPSNMVPGIEPSPDIMLQARMFAYPDAARYRLGVNYQQLPTNASKASIYVPTERDGQMNFGQNYRGDPNYVGTSLKEIQFAKKRSPIESRVVQGAFPEAVGTTVTPDDFEQPRALWREVMAKQKGVQERFLENIRLHVACVKDADLRDKVYEMFGRVDVSLGLKLRNLVEIGST